MGQSVVIEYYLLAYLQNLFLEYIHKPLAHCLVHLYVLDILNTKTSAVKSIETSGNTYLHAKCIKPYFEKKKKFGFDIWEKLNQTFEEEKTDPTQSLPNTF